MAVHWLNPLLEVLSLTAGEAKLGVSLLLTFHKPPLQKRMPGECFGVSLDSQACS